jgi:three-Cys-motif partner protein
MLQVKRYPCISLRCKRSPRVGRLRLDEIGYWSEVKLDIVRRYATEYSTIMNKQGAIRRFAYIDGFAGAGVHLSKQTGQMVTGSPLNALQVDPPFSEYHFIDLDGGRATKLKELAAGRQDIEVYAGDCNKVLLEKVFPRCQYEDFHRALCLLDPYGLHVDWKVIETAGKMGSIEIFYNFMIMDANMNVLWRDPDKIKESQARRMDVVWGDRTWREVAYKKTRDLFEEFEEKVGNPVIADAFQERLKKKAEFKYVPKPIPMRNTNGAVVYYLFFASPNKTGAKIVEYIFNKYRDKGVS